MSGRQNQIDSQEANNESQRIVNPEGQERVHKYRECVKNMYKNCLSYGIKIHYIVSVKFVEIWESHCLSKEFSSTLQSRIISDDIFEEGKLKKGLKYKHHYLAVDQNTYEQFKLFVSLQNQNQKLVKWQKDEQTNQLTPFFFIECNYLMLNQLTFRKIDCGYIEATQLKYKTLCLKQIQNINHMLACIQRSQKIDSSTVKLQLWHRLKDHSISKVYEFIRNQLVGLSFPEYSILNIGKMIKVLTQPLSALTPTNKIFFLIEEIKPNSAAVFIENFEGICKGCHSKRTLLVQCPCKKIQYCSEQCRKVNLSDHRSRCEYYEEIQYNKQIKMVQDQRSVNGVAGLENLGNTCYMNSCLQCLSNTLPLTQYFLRQCYEDEINKKNTFGTRGRLAKTYAKFIRAVWCEPAIVFSPKNLKDIISKINPIFSGSAQHDAQEFFSFLIDGLHEDLNRVQPKKQVQMEEIVNKPEAQLAKLSWKNHIARNQSIITDLMTGQYRSAIICPNCKEKSLKFQTFNTVTLPIPLESSINFYVIYQNQYKKNFKAQFKYRNLDPYEWIRKASEAVGIENPQTCQLYIVTQKENTYKVGRLPMEQVVKKIEKDNKILFLIEKTDQEMKIPKDDLLELTIFMTQPDNDRKQLYFKFPMFFNKRTANLLEISKKIYKYIYNQAYNQLKGNPVKSIQTREYEQYEQNMIRKKLFKVYLKLGKTIQRIAKKSEAKFSQQIQLTKNMIVYDQLNKYKTNPQDCEIQIRFIHPDQTKQFTFHKIKKYDEIGKSYAQSLNQQISLENCLQAFSQPQTLMGGNEWYCPRCKQLKKAIKQINIYRSPQILVLQLKRFKQKEWTKQKINSLVKFPFELDLTKYVVDEKPIQAYKKELEREGYLKPKSPFLQYIRFSTKSQPIYELYAVSNHIGELGGGHYTAYAKNNQNWIKFDDSRLKPVEKREDIVSPEAFLLFYQRKQT